MAKKTCLTLLGNVMVAALLLGGCTSVGYIAPTPTDGPQAVVQTQSSALAQPAACENRFVPHPLNVYNGVRIREITTYLSNGSGVAAADLNGDGLLDLVFARIDGGSVILWNQGNLAFKEQDLNNDYARMVSAVDVDGDGKIDLVFTSTGLQEVNYWHNEGGGAFKRGSLPGVTYRAHALAWGDLNGDGMLDLVTGSYDADLKQHMTDMDQLAKITGVVYYEQTSSGFVPQRLQPTAEALSIGLVDLNNDNRPDIYNANDFLAHDRVWTQDGASWKLIQPFEQTSYSTMSIEWGDLNNRGQTDIFTSDMNPYDITPYNMAVWLPVMDKLEERHDPNDPQIMANVLQVPVAKDQWRSISARSGVDATGWSWSGRFGDLDNDGFLDLYVVNGMIAKNLFDHLPNYELIEENQAFRNDAKGGFAHAPQWGLNSTLSGRGMVMADLNMDGNLDIIINNLRDTAMVYENRLCGGDALEVDLRWPESKNPYAIGAQLELHTSMGVLRRDVRASGGYLSTDPARVHFGFPAGTQLNELVVRWPDGAVSRLSSPMIHSLLQVTR